MFPIGKKVTLFSIGLLIIAMSAIILAKGGTVTEADGKGIRFIVVDEIKEKINKKKIANEFTISIEKIDLKAPVVNGVDLTNKQEYNEISKSC